MKILAIIDRLNRGTSVTVANISSPDYSSSPSLGCPLYYHLLLSSLSLCSPLFPTCICLLCYLAPILLAAFSLLFLTFISFFTCAHLSQLFCSHSEHVQHTAHKTGIKRKRLQLEIQEEGWAHTSRTIRKPPLQI